MSLYKINSELEKLLEIDDEIINTETGEIHDKQYLANLKEAFLTQTESFGLWLKNQNSLIGAIKAEEKAFAERRKFLEKRLERNEAFCLRLLQDCLNGKFETAKIKLSLRKSESVKIDNQDNLDRKFIKVKIEEVPDKTAIKQAIKSGAVVEGAELIENYNLQIK